MREKIIEEKLTKAVQQNGYLVYSYKPLPEAERETYKRFKSELILERQDTEITAANAVALSNNFPSWRMERCMTTPEQ